MLIQCSQQPIANLSAIGTCDDRTRRSRRRAMPSAEVAVVDNRRACACAIRPTIERVRTRDTRQNRLITRAELTVPARTLNQHKHQLCRGTNK